MPARSPYRGLDRAEALTTAAAVVVSSTGYALGGEAYLARGVVGDLLGFAVLGAVLASGRRLRHEALLCLVGIGLVLLVSPDWPLRVPEAAWWGLFSLGLTAYVVPRQLLTTSRP